MSMHWLQTDALPQIVNEQWASDTDAAARKSDESRLRESIALPDSMQPSVQEQAEAYFPQLMRSETKGRLRGGTFCAVYIAGEDSFCRRVNTLQNYLDANRELAHLEASVSLLITLCNHDPILLLDARCMCNALRVPDNILSVLTCRSGYNWQELRSWRGKRSCASHSGAWKQGRRSSWVLGGRAQRHCGQGISETQRHWREVQVCSWHRCLQHSSIAPSVMLQL